MIRIEDDATVSYADRCAQEPVHLTGHIQSHGLLFALSEPDFIVRQVSANVGALGGIPTDVVLGRSFEAVVGAGQFEIFDRACGPTTCFRPIRFACTSAAARSI